MLKRRRLPNSDARPCHRALISVPAFAASVGLELDHQGRDEGHGPAVEGRRFKGPAPRRLQRDFVKPVLGVKAPDDTRLPNAVCANHHVD